MKKHGAGDGPQDKRVHKALMSFRRIMTSAKRHLSARVEEAKGSTLSGAQLWALWHVKDSPGLTVLELTHKLSVHQTTTSNLIEKLESAGCLRRERDPNDKRVVRLFATSAGAKILKSAPDVSGGSLSAAFNRLSGKELAALELALDSLSRELGTVKKNTKGSFPT